MTGSYGKLDVMQREIVWDLKRRKFSSAEVVRVLQEGDPDAVPPVMPVTVSAQAVSAYYRKRRRETDQLYETKVQGLTTADGMDLLVRKLIVIADKEASRLGVLQSKGKLPARQLGLLAGATERIHKLAALREREPNPTDPGGDRDGNGDDDGFAASLIAGSSTPVADVPVAGAVPSDLPPVSQGNGDS